MQSTINGLLCFSSTVIAESTSVSVEAPVPVKKANRCQVCKKRVGLTGELCWWFFFNLSFSFMQLRQTIDFQVLRVVAVDFTVVITVTIRRTTAHSIIRRWSAKRSVKTIPSLCRTRFSESRPYHTASTTPWIRLPFSSYSFVFRRHEEKSMFFSQFRFRVSSSLLRFGIQFNWSVES